MKRCVICMLLLMLTCIGCESGSDIMDDEGNTRLHKVSESCSNTSTDNNCNQIEKFVKAGTDVNIKNKEGETPLHVAASFGSIDAVKALIAAGADVNAKTNIDWTPLHVATLTGKKDAINVLISAGADVNAKGTDGTTPLHFVKLSNIENIDINDSYDVKRIHKAEACIKALLAAGADVNAKNSAGEVALDNQTMEIIKKLQAFEQQKEVARQQEQAAQQQANERAKQQERYNKSPRGKCEQNCSNVFTRGSETWGYCMSGCSDMRAD